MDLSELKLIYSIGDISKITHLNNEVKGVLLISLLGEMSNDKNSSSFREGVTLSVLGVKQSNNKLGYDSDEYPIEVKPKNITLLSDNKFDGSGNFSDFTWKRHKKYYDDDVKMVVSGFLDGKLMFLLSFKYKSNDFINKIEDQLTKQLPNGDEINRYVRNVKFSYIHFKDSETFKIEFISPIISDYEHKFTKPFFKVITEYGIKK
jgi:hypothetical protein